MNFRIICPGAAALACLATALLAGASRANAQTRNPVSKFFVADLNGDAQVNTGTEIDDLVKKSVYNAQGTVIETKAKSNYAMVYSNGTGIYFDPSTKVAVDKFQQEPFRPNRTDMDVEPSVSHTDAHIERGTVGLCTSKQVAGSNMTYSTPQGSVNIRGREVVIDVENNVTRISMLEGESTVQGGEKDLAGKTLHDGEQATITSAGPGRPPKVEIAPIPPAVRSVLLDKVTAACIARKTVYFEVASGKSAGGLVAAAGDSRSGGSPGASSSGSQSDPQVTAFDAPAVNGNPGGNTVVNNAQQVIVAVQVVPPIPPSTTPISNSFLSGH